MGERLQFERSCSDYDLPETGRLLVTLGYTHTFIRDGKLAVGAANPASQPFGYALTGVAKASADMLALGLTYQWSDRAL